MSYDWDDEFEQEEFEHEETKELVWRAIAELRAGNTVEALTILERTVRPKWWKSSRAAEAYAEAKAEANKRADAAFESMLAQLSAQQPEPKEWR